MKQKFKIKLLLWLPLLLLALVACGGSESNGPEEVAGLSVDELAGTKAAELIAATEAFEQAVADEVNARATQDAGNLPTNTPLPVPTSTPERVKGEAEENAAAGGNFNIRQEDPNAEVENAPQEEVENNPEPTQEPTPIPEPTATATLFPVVKQGAPGDRKGIEGNIFAPAGLQPSTDPAVFGEQISFLAQGILDPAVGPNEGDGVQSVAFIVSSELGLVYHNVVDDTPTYCAFGGDGNCDVWDFAANGFKWPGGAPAESGFYNAEIIAVGTDGSKTAKWTYDFALDFGDLAQAEPVAEPTQVVQAEPTATLFPVVKQGAPSQKNGVLGNVYAPAGLQISSDPAIFGNNINFMLLEAYDEASGSTVNGAGIRDVTFTVTDSAGAVVYQLVEGKAAYCAFGGDVPCNTWNFAQHGNSWPGGVRAKSGNYKATIVGVGNSGASSTWNYEFAIEIDDTLVPAGPTVRINSISLSGDRYVVNFVTTGYQPVLPGQHIHFFFNTVPPGQAGSPGGGPWVLYPNSNGGSGASPFTLYGVGDKPAGATQMCALVANPNHSVQQGTGNCHPLP